MNEIQSSLFETMKQFSNYTKNSSTSSVTIEGRIEEIKDAGTGIYSINYLGNTIDCYSTNGMSYSIGDNVYVLVPDGDFSKNKIILGLINTKEKQNFVKKEDNVIYYETTQNLFTNPSHSSVGIASYTNNSFKVNLCTNQTDANLVIKLMNDLIKEGKNTFCLKFWVKTELIREQQNGGNYGVKISIPVITEFNNTRQEKVYSLDVSNMMGNPYCYEDWSLQKIYFTIDSKYTIAQRDWFDFIYLTFFTKGFPIQDESKHNLYDIFFKDISFFGVEALAETIENDLSLTIQSSEGIYFSSNYSQTKTLIPIFKYQGKEINIENNPNVEIYWFQEDTSVQFNSEYYCVYGGYGWKCLNEKTDVIMNEDGINTWNWVTNISKITISSLDFYSILRYKCVIIYNGYRIERIITLKNIDSSTFLKLSTPVENNIFSQVGYAIIIATVHIDNITDNEAYRNNIIYKWSRYDRFNNLIEEQYPIDGSSIHSIIKTIQQNEIVDNNYVTKLQIPLAYIEEFNYVYCSAKFIGSDNKEKIIGTESIRVSSEEFTEYTLTINNDNIIYKYDSNGISPAQTGSYHGPASSKVTSIAPLSYTIRKRDGEELTGYEYAQVYYKWTVPDDSESLFVIENSALHPLEGYDNIDHNIILPYKIKSYYNKTSASNKIYLTVTINNKIELTQVVNISFLKEGENGSNGTEYVAEIVGGGGSTLSNSYPYGTIIETEYNSSHSGIKYVEKQIRKTAFLCDTSVPFLNYNSVRCRDTRGNYDSYLTNSSVYNKLFVNVYKNGQLLSFNKYEVEWSMYDNNWNNENCFYITTETQYSQMAALGKRLPPSAQTGTLDINGNYCNIVQVKVKIKGEKNKDLYAYYPIDLILVNSSSVAGQYPDTEICGGFSEVMYNSQATRPQYDNSKDIFYLDKAELERNILNYEDTTPLDLKDYYDISWEASNHLTLTEESSNSVKVSPTYRYDDGNTCNFIKAIYAVKDEKIQELQSKLSEYETDRNNAQANLTRLNNLRSRLSTINTQLGDLYRWAPNAFSSIKQIFAAETNACNSLQILDSLIKKLNDFINMHNESFNDPYFNLLKSWKNALIDIIPTAVTRIQTFDYYTVTTSDLITLESYHFDDSSPTYKELLELNIFLEFDSIINQINQEITQYQKYYQDMLTYGGMMGAVYGIAQALQGISQLFDPSILDDCFMAIKDKLLYYRDRLFEVTSFTQRQDIINQIFGPECCLLIWTSNWELNESTRRYLENKELEYGYEYENANMQYNAISAMLKDINSTSNPMLVAIKPIIFYMDRYELNNLNMWDGNKIETGEDDRYLLAPQVGGLRKESDNTTTGIIIGQRNIDLDAHSQEQQVGLFGLSHNKISIFMNAENGSAIFGLGDNGGQIIVDPVSRKALLYSNNFWKSGIYNDITLLPSSYPSDSFINHIGRDDDYYCNKQGMIIDLSTPEIAFGSGLFSVDSSGHLRCAEATVSGTITATGGEIGGWQIYPYSPDPNDPPEGIHSKNGKIHLVSTGDGAIYSESHSSLISTVDGFYIGCDGLSLGRYFRVDDEGNLQASNVDLTGEINATSGEIAGFTISDSNLVYDDSTTLTAGDHYFGIHTHTGSGFEIECGKKVDRYFPDAQEPLVRDQRLVSVGHKGELYLERLSVKQPVTYYTRNYRFIATYLSPQDLVDHPELENPYANDLYYREGSSEEMIECEETSPVIGRDYYTLYEEIVQTDSSDGKGGIWADGAITSYSGIYIESELKNNSNKQIALVDGNYTSRKGHITLTRGSAYIKGSGITTDPSTGETIDDGGHLHVDQDVWIGTNATIGDTIFLNQAWIDEYGVVHQTSDSRLKKDIKSLDVNVENFIYSLNPVEFKYNKDKENEVHHGLIAQEVIDRIDNPNRALVQGDEYLSVAYTELIADLIQVVQSQNKRIEQLEKKIKEES